MSDELPARLQAGPPHGAVGPFYVASQPQAVPHLAGSTQRFVAYLFRYWWVMALSTIGALVTTGGYLLWAPPTFISTARMWETERMRLPEEGAITSDLQNYLGTQIELLQSHKLHQLALEQLRASGTNAVPLDKYGQPIRLRVRVAQVPKTTVLEARAYSADPRYAQAFLNALMAQYLEYKKAVRRSVSGDTLSSISQQAVGLEKELKANQDALTDFERSNNLAILEEEGRAAGGYLARLKTQLSDLELESELLEASAVGPGWPTQPGANAIELSLNSGATVNPSATSPIAAERQTAWNELELLKLQREKLSKYLRPEHPKIVKLDADIERGQKLVDLYKNQSRTELEAARRSLNMRFISVRDSIKLWETKVLEANSRIAEADRLKLNVSRTQSLYDRLMLVLQNVDIGRNVERETLAVFEPASAAQRSHLWELVLLALALVLGPLAGGGLVFLVQVYDDRFSSALEVDERFGDSIVAQIPEVQPAACDGSLPPLEQEQAAPMYAESYRNLRSALLFLPLEGKRPRSLLITSALPSEGKSTIALNLAKSLALGGARVLLVDGDLRKGHLHDLLGRNCAPGLAEVLAGTTDADSVIQPDSHPTLRFLARGSSAGNPGDLLLRRELDELLARWRQEFDYVLIDSCPVFAADDVTTLANKVDGTLFVVRRRFSRASVVHQALSLLLHRQAKVLGLIFNRADASARSYQYYKYADYHSPGQP